MITTIVFDLDDTLYPEADFVLSGLSAAADWMRSHRNVVDFFAAARKHFLSGVRGHIFDLALVDCGCVPEPSLVQKLVEVYRSHSPTITLFDDARWALDHFRDQRLKLALLTDGFLMTQRRKVAALSLEDWIPHIVYSDALGRSSWKPSPAPYSMLESQSGSHPSECVYVGDNPLKDFVAARTRGWWTVHIRRPRSEYGNRLAPPGYSADVEIPTLRLLPESIPSRNS